MGFFIKAVAEQQKGRLSAYGLLSVSHSKPLERGGRSVSETCRHARWGGLLVETEPKRSLEGKCRDTEKLAACGRPSGHREGEPLGAACVQQIQPQKPLEAAQLERVPGGKDSKGKDRKNIPFNMPQEVDKCFCHLEFPQSSLFICVLVLRHWETIDTLTSRGENKRSLSWVWPA